MLFLIRAASCLAARLLRHAAFVGGVSQKEWQPTREVVSNLQSSCDLVVCSSFIEILF